jgi:hypothetical protein
VNRSNLPKPILTRGPVGALRYAWLRAPPSAVPKTDQDLSEALTHKSPYEGGQTRICAVPTIYTHRRHPEVLAVLYGEPRRMSHKRA